AGLSEVIHWFALGVVVLVIVAPAGRPPRFLEFSLAVALGAGFSGFFGMLDLAGLGIFAPVWDPPGPAGAFDAMEFATAYYVVAMPIVTAAVVRYTGRLRGIFGVSFLLTSLHFGVVASWTFAAVFAGICLFVALFIAIFQRSQSLLALYPVFALLGIAAIILGGGKLLFEAPPLVSDATSLPQITVIDGLRDDVVREAQVRNPLFGIDRTEVPLSSEAYPYLIGVGTDLFSEQPVIGHGPGSWWILQTKTPRIDDSYVRSLFDVYPAHRSPHNGFVKLIVEFGLIGLLFFALWLIGVLYITISALTYRSERAAWLIEHWALTTSLFAGLVFMCVTPLLEFSAPAVIWIASIAMLTRLSSAINDFKDWSGIWSLHRQADDPGKKRFLFVGALALLLGAAVIVPVTLQAVSNYHRGHADHLMLRTHYERAVDAYRQAHQWYPSDGEVPYNIALALYRVGELTTATAEINQAIEMRPYDARVFNLATLAHLRNGDQAAAMQTGRRAVQLNPNDMDARRAYAAALQLRGRFDEAATVLNDGLRRNPPRVARANMHQRLAEIYEGPLEQPRQAIEHYRKALEGSTPGTARTLMKEKVEELENRIERERLIREGKPVPPELMPPKHDHHHGHGH
ncbi:MAG: tetratricopeptide repeat protein, partial [Bradymonadaceae bacterium]